MDFKLADKTKKMKNEELNIQTAIINYLRMNNILCFHVPNGAYFKSIATRSLMKRAGLLSGVSDLIIILKNRIVFIEVKTKKGKQSENQKIFEKQVKKLGFEYYIWRDVFDAVNFLEKNK